MTELQGIRGRIFVVGAGAAGSSLARALASSGHAVDAVVSRTASRASDLASKTGARYGGDEYRYLDVADLVILAVPDDAIRVASSDLAGRREDWSGAVVCHLSGALSSAELGRLESLGALTASFHPMVSLQPESTPEVFKGARINIEGHDSAVEVCREMARAIGAMPFVIGHRTKQVIHMAATIASNYLVTLLAVASELLKNADVPPEEFEGLFRPLVEATLRNIRFESPARALTGPIARADAATLRTQLELVREHYTEYLPMISILASETIRAAAVSGRISLEESEDLLHLVGEIIESSSPC